MSGDIKVVYFDIGGPIYDDGIYATALLEALRELGVEVDEASFRAAYDSRRRRQSGLTRPLAQQFGVDPGALARTVAGRWHYPPQALHPDVLPTLDNLALRYRIGVLANQPQTIRTALERDNIAPYINVWIISDEVGFAKPDPRIFEHAIAAAGCTSEHVAFVGNRLDHDVRPARAAGMRAIWLLRGEAPDEPTSGQLAEADASIRSLAELPRTLDRPAAAVDL